MTTTANTTTKEIGFDAEARAALAKFVEAKDLLDRATAQKEEAEAVLRAVLGDATTATVGGSVAYQLLSRVRTDIDRKALKADFPEIYAALETSTAYDFIKVAR